MNYSLEQQLKQITENRDHLRALLIEAQDTAKEWLEKYDRLLEESEGYKNMICKLEDEIVRLQKKKL